jgi:glycogen(starch) synthase
VTRPLRVAVLSRAVFPLHGYGGLERHVYDLVRHLAGRGVRVTLITRPPSSPHTTPFEPPFTDMPVDVRFVPYVTFPFAGRRGTTVLDRSTAYPLFGERAGRLAASMARAGDVDLVHGLGASALGYARRRAGLVPFVFNPQGIEEFGATDPGRARLKRWGYWPLQIAVRTCARAADRVIATDRALEPAVRAHLPVPVDRIRVVPNAIDLERGDRLAAAASRLRPREAAGISPDEAVLLSVGRLERNKGFEVLAEALARLARTDRAHAPVASWRWVLLGAGPNRQRLERVIRECGIADRVLLPGRISDEALHAWYEAAALFVHPTLYEGSSLVTLEAMARRRAVVASSAGGLPDKVRPGTNGWLVPPGDVDALAAALREALADPARLAAMGSRSRAIVEEEFAWPAVAGRLLDVYAELVPGPFAGDRGPDAERRGRMGLG